VAVVAAAVALVGCSGRNDALGEGPDVNACVAYQIYNQFREPSPTERDDVLAYTGGMVRLMERVRGDFKIKIEKKPDLLASKEVLDAYDTIRSSMAKARDAAEAAGSDTERLKAAGNDLAADEAYLAADARVTDFFVDECAASRA